MCAEPPLKLSSRLGEPTCQTRPALYLRSIRTVGSPRSLGARNRCAQYLGSIPCLEASRF